MSTGVGILLADDQGRFGLDFSMAVVAVPFILYLVRFSSSKSCTRIKYFLGQESFPIVRVRT